MLGDEALNVRAAKAEHLPSVPAGTQAHGEDARVPSSRVSFVPNQLRHLATRLLRGN